MKFLFAVTLLFWGLANAAVTECSDGRGRTGTTYTLVTGWEKAVVTSTSPGANDMREPSYLGSGEPISRSENGDFSVTIDKTYKVDWKKQSKCWVNAGSKYVFTVSQTNASLDIYPNLQINPKVVCNAPKLMRGHVPLTCQELQ